MSRSTPQRRVHAFDVVDAFWGPINFRWTVSDWSIPGECYTSGAGHGHAEFAMGEHCEMLDIFLPDLATTGTIRVRLT